MTTLLGFEEFRIAEFSTQKQKALFSTQAYVVGEAIYPFDYWSQEVMPMHLSNHSCDPNGRFDESGMLVAVRAIAAEEEITFDYLAHPLPASPWNFECLCGASNCRGWIKAADIQVEES
ncbi:MAG: SET domain-containing protein-lysine N-methyltransferase [Acidobacteria bacterium]|nr:SET domain-containing protein-lysine N-methyltransferase [Acidobacteriota bacterium]